MTAATFQVTDVPDLVTLRVFGVPCAVADVVKLCVAIESIEIGTASSDDTSYTRYATEWKSAEIGSLGRRLHTLSGAHFSSSDAVAVATRCRHLRQLAATVDDSFSSSDTGRL